MRGLATKTRVGSVLKLLRRNEDGATMIEFAMVLAIFLLIFFGLIDFGRLAFHYVTAEKAMHIAARIAAVRPAACLDVPDLNVRGVLGVEQVPPKFGSLCNANQTVNTCANPGTISCDGDLANGTASEIWTRVSGALPNHAKIEHLKFTYTFDENLGFLGGPYVPVVTVELQNLKFEFVTPMGTLASLVTGNTQDGLQGDIEFPSMSVSLPGEDLSMGENG